jgi:hypothetical protein
MNANGELIWTGPRLYHVWQCGGRHKYIGTLVANTKGWAAWAKGVRLGAWPDEARARQALEEFARLEPRPRNQTQYLNSTIYKDATR